MSVTIFETLMNAEVNLDNVKNTPPGPMSGVLFGLARDQLHNAVALLVKGYDLGDEVEPLLEKHGDVEDVPIKITPSPQGIEG